MPPALYHIKKLPKQVRVQVLYPYVEQLTNFKNTCYMYRHILRTYYQAYGRFSRVDREWDNDLWGSDDDLNFQWNEALTEWTDAEYRLDAFREWIHNVYTTADCEIITNPSIPFE